MTRKKVALEWMTNAAARRATYKKRLEGLMKKASELATLCAISVCVVVYAEGKEQPDVWPSMDQASQILSRYKTMPDLDNFKKTLNQDGLLRQRITKIQAQVAKEDRETREQETKVLLHDAIVGRLPGLVGLTVEQLTSLSSMVQMRLKSVKDCIEQLNGQNHMAPPQMFSSPLAISYAAGNMQATNAPMYHVPQQQERLISDGGLGAVVYGARTITGADMTPLSNMGEFYWPDVPGPSNRPM